MSIQQACADNYLDVVSLGSKEANIGPEVLNLAKQFAHVIVWADNAETAKKWANAIPGAMWLRSPGGMDANDLLQAGLLQEFFAAEWAKVDPIG